MFASRNRRAARRGAAVVEAALVLSVFFMFLFGVLEYCRYLLFLHTVTNAARDDARYATVNVSQANDFDTTDATYVDAGGATQPRLDSYGNRLVAIQQYTKNRMGGVDRMITGIKVDVYPVEPTGQYASPPTFDPKAGWGPDPATRTVHWNAAAFTERIAVRVTGTYKPILPSFLWMQNTAPVKIVAVMGSEG